jgi:hypothetical protein
LFPSAASLSINFSPALRGDPSIVARIERVPRGNILDAYAELMRVIQARAAKGNADQPPTAQLALPNGDAVSDSRR